MVFLSVLSEGALYCAAMLADVVHIESATAGMTLLAFGGQVPDTIAAVALAREGMPDAAVSQAVASQVINITLGIGLPFLIYSLITGKPTITGDNEAIVLLAETLLLIIIVYLFTMLMGCRGGGQVSIGRCGAVFLMLAFGVIYFYSIAAVLMKKELQLPW